MPIRKSLPLALFLAVFAASAASAAKAPKIKVPDDQPTIQDAIDAACAGGGRISVAAGDYMENPSIVNCQNVTLESKGAVIIGGGGAPTVLIQTSSSITIKGFGITMGDLNGVQVTTSNDVLVSQNEIYDNDGVGVGVNNLSTQVEIFDNEIRGSVDVITGCTTQGHGVQSASPGVLIKKNDIHDNDCDGTTTTGDGNRIEKNTIQGNGRRGITSNTNALIKDNTITGNTDDGVRAGGGDTLTNNRISGNGGDGVEVRSTFVTLMRNQISGNGANGVLAWTEIINNVRFPRANRLTMIGNRSNGNTLAGLNADGNDNTIVDRNQFLGNVNGIRGIRVTGQVQRNQANKNFEDGILIGATTSGSVFYQNRADQNVDDGFSMSPLALSNSIEKNRARKNGDVDFEGLAGADPSNTFVKNNFKTTN